MCGIAGAVRTRMARAAGRSRPGNSTTAIVQRITDAEHHRGPDGAGLWHSSGQEVVFGHRRLAILDLSEAGAQPMIEPESGCVITFNGEIYNFREIRHELAAQGESFRSSSDTEVILKAFRRWGVDSVQRFRGIFAFALWDPRARVVHLVRDPMGIKPLYWTTVEDRESGEEMVLFASEIRALLASDVVPRRLAADAVASYLWHGFVVGPDTIIEDVRLLPAASVLTLAVDDGLRPNGTGRIRGYWEMPSSTVRESTAGELREELLRTVGMQLVSDVPLGVFLSGGIDSSAVAALASEAARDPVHTFTIGFDVEGYDESRYAEQVAAVIGSRHTRSVLTEQIFQEQLPDALAAIDQPTFDAINTYFVSRSARNAGMTVALAGTGGDELFGGYPSYLEIPRARRAFGWLPSAHRPGVMRRALNGTMAFGARLAGRVSWDVFNVAPRQTRWGKAADLACALPDVLGLYQVSYALFTRETQAILATRRVREAQGRQLHGLPAAASAAWRGRTEGSELRHAISLLELSSFVGERLLRDTDSASMAVSLEVRVPLLDHVLMETIAGIDAESRFSPPRKKQLLRDVALSGLDPALFDRPKSGFVLPIDTWARRRLQPQMQEVLSDPALAARAGLRSESVRTLWQSFLAGRPGLYWSRVWAIYILLGWCQAHDVSLAA